MEDRSMTEIILSADPAWFGAKGDGITDDTQAMQDTIQWLLARGGGTLDGSWRTYKVSKHPLKWPGDRSVMITHCQFEVEEIEGNQDPSSN
jgi:hypothetical protein